MVSLVRYSSMSVIKRQSANEGIARLLSKLIHLQPHLLGIKNAKEDTRQLELMKKNLPRKRKIIGVENVIVVASGKGGVGKSTLAVNLALSLAKINDGSNVGLLDMDVFGPSIPRMMNLSGFPELDKDENLIPLMNYGVKCMSMGFLVDENAAIIWRGPMVMSAVQRLLLRTAWGSLNYLIIDLPPGTGDTQLSISQLVAVSGSVIISTPQDIALLDARRGAEMFSKVKIPVLGLVQNMSVFICPKCGHEEHIFGDDGVSKMAQSLGVELLGNVPLHSEIRKCADDGKPIVIESPNSLHTLSYLKIAKAVKKKLDELPKV